ncbi:flavin reductase family protein [Aspergillus ibericus CBS 121593]|uniref:Flavin reductase like domain-containing protein n=1 Tax=Aspergillus ibericus CBS 121593 TaxID=1448316 RepID=A0A395H7A2_9EURO|nr:hypothetical protein BO80DRAFT_453540 [Aspergillus ibericus CBS 121593]RAL03383.1 hypothetical protein BO80DRAFT_453540 [Aspergillus ibericus CBS 121593]
MNSAFCLAKLYFSCQFTETEATHPDFNKDKPIEITKSPYPNWKYREGMPDNKINLTQKHHKINPYTPDQPTINNYRLLLSGIAPRPISFLSTVNSEKQKNLSPFSYFQVINHNPPIFIIGFSSRLGRVKDTYHNLKETREYIINTISKNIIKAINTTSIDTPYSAPSTTIKPSRVEESVFNIKDKIKEGTTDTDYNHINLNKLRPIGQLNSISYSHIISTFKQPRNK